MDNESDRKYLEVLTKYCKETHAVLINKKKNLLKNILSKKPLSVSGFYDDSMQRFVNRLLGGGKIDKVLCYCSSMAEYVFRSPFYKTEGNNSFELIMDYVDLDSDKWLQYAQYTNFPLNLVYKTENKRLFKYEVEINESFNHSIFVSKREEKVFKELYPDAKNVLVIPNGVDTDFFYPNKKSVLHFTPHPSPLLLFTGVMDYFANEDAVSWFCRNIFPIIKQELPGAEFYIVGNNPTNAVWTLTEIEGVSVTGYVDDIREYYWAADICVMPLRIARGLQNKVLESMATGNAVVATSNASDGIICENNKDILIENSEKGFAQAVIRLYKDIELRKSIQKNAIDNILKNYLWDSNLKAFNEILK